MILTLANSYSDEQLRSLRNGFGILAFVGAVFLALALLVFCIALARRLARRRARLNAARQPEPATQPLDIWSESARRMDLPQDPGKPADPADPADPGSTPGRRADDDPDGSSDADAYGSDDVDDDGDEDDEDGDHPWS